VLRVLPVSAFDAAIARPSRDRMTALFTSVPAPPGHQAASPGRWVNSGLRHSPALPTHLVPLPSLIAWWPASRPPRDWPLRDWPLRDQAVPHFRHRLRAFAGGSKSERPRSQPCWMAVTVLLASSGERSSAAAGAAAESRSGPCARARVLPQLRGQAGLAHPVRQRLRVGEVPVTIVQFAVPGGLREPGSLAGGQPSASPGSGNPWNRSARCWSPRCRPPPGRPIRRSRPRRSRSPPRRGPSTDRLRCRPGHRSAASSGAATATLLGPADGPVARARSPVTAVRLSVSSGGMPATQLHAGARVRPSCW